MSGHVQGVDETLDSAHKKSEFFQVRFFPARFALGAIDGAIRRVLLNLLPKALKFIHLQTHTRTEVWSENRPAERGVWTRDTTGDFNPQCQAGLSSTGPL